MSLGASPYHQLPGLEDVYLEDSYMTRTDESPGRLEIGLEAVLREGHPLYKPPAAEEQYSYRAGRLVFANAERIHWTERHPIPSADASGEVDYGNIDTLFAINGGYVVEGDWGRLR